MHVLWVMSIILLPACQQCQSNQQSSKNTDTLSVAWDSMPKSLDPRFGNDAHSFYLSDLVHCSLIEFNENGDTTSGLASKWTWTSPTNLSVDLKQNIVFASGKPVTAKDVKATYDFFKRTDLKKVSPLAGAYKKIKEIKVVNDHKVDFHLSEPEISFVTNLVVGILPAEQANNENIKPENLDHCGAFKLSKISVNDLYLSQNPKHNLGSVPKLKEINIKIVKDESTRLAKLKKGELDLVQNTISLDQMKTVENNKSLSVTKGPGLNTVYFGFNFKDKLMSNPKARQAIAYAIHKNQLIKHILSDYAEPAHSLILKKSNFYAEHQRFDYDIEKAKALVSELQKENVDLKFKIKTSTNKTQITIAKAIAKQLTDIGFTVKVESLEWGKFMDDIKKGLAQTWIGRWVGYKDPDIFRYVFLSEMAPPNGGNRGFYQNPGLDQLLKDASKTIDPAARVSKYSEVQKIVQRELPYVFLWHTENYAVLRNNVNGFKLYADGRYSSLKQVSKTAK